jgi:hypothetical protein
MRPIQGSKSSKKSAAYLEQLIVLVKRYNTAIKLVILLVLIKWGYKKLLEVK